MDEGDAGHRPAGRRPSLGSLDAALVGDIDAGENLDQRRLSGAVLAEQRVDLAG